MTYFSISTTCAGVFAQAIAENAVGYNARTEPPYPAWVRSVSSELSYRYSLFSSRQMQANYTRNYE